MTFMKINRKLLPIKVFYFLWNAGTAPIVPYMTVFARQLNFSSKEIGIIYTIAPILTIIVKPLTGAFADKYKCQKIVFIIAQIITVLSVCSIIFLPKDSKQLKYHQINFRCDDQNDGVQMCNSDLNNLEIEGCDYTCYALSNLTSFEEDDQVIRRDLSKVVDSISRKCVIENQTLSCRARCFEKGTRRSSETYSWNYTFWLLMVVYLIDFFGRASTIIIGDAICFQVLDDAPHKYGYQRMFGALGWGVVSLFTGYMIDALTIDQTNGKNYTSAFWMGAAILSLCAITSHFIKFSQVESSKYMLKEAKTIFGNFPAFVFLVWCTFSGTFVAIERNYLFFFLDDLAAAQGTGAVSDSKTIQGVAMAARCLAGELPFFFVSGRILKRVKHVTVMSLILLVTGIRLIMYSFLSEPWFVVPLEVINGWTFGIFYSTMASYASSISTPTTKATVQGLVGALYEGAGSSVGALVGGFLYDDFGGSQTFLIYGLVTLICFFLHVTIQYLIKRCKTKDMSTTMNEEFASVKDFN